MIQTITVTFRRQFSDTTPPPPITLTKTGTEKIGYNFAEDNASYRVYCGNRTLIFPRDVVFSIDMNI